MNKKNGFTLIELLIVVTIVGVLALVAYPSYQDNVRKTRRADAMTAVLTIQLAQQGFRSNCRFYAQNLGGTNTCGASAALSTVNASNASPDGFYTLAIQANSASANAYTIVATPQGTQTADTQCATMTLTVSAANPSGLKAPAGCW